MDQCDIHGRVWRHPAKEKVNADWKQSTYNYRLGLHIPDILLRLAKGESMASIGRLYGCSYQAIQYIRRTHGTKGTGT